MTVGRRPLLGLALVLLALSAATTSAARAASSHAHRAASSGAWYDGALAFGVHGSGGGGAVGVMTYDPQTDAQTSFRSAAISTTSDVVATQPSWLPDGTGLVVTGQESWWTIPGTISTTGEDFSPLGTYAWQGEGSFSPDGRYLIARKTSSPYIYVYPQDGTTSYMLTIPSSSGVLDTGDWDTRWSPSGDRIVFDAVEGWSLWGWEYYYTNCGIYTINVDGSGLQRIASSGQYVSPADGACGAPSWSPDGNTIAYPIGGRIHLINPDGSNNRLLDPNGALAANEDWPTFSPSGDYLAFVANGAEIEIVSLLTGQVVKTYSLSSGLAADHLTWGRTHDDRGLPIATDGLSIRGNPATDDQLSLPLDQITWLNPPTSANEQWLRCDATGANCTPIQGATGETYTLVAADNLATLAVQVTATNDNGSTMTETPSTAQVNLGAANVSPPTISGSVVAGAVLTASPGVWAHVTDPFPVYQWDECDSAGGNCGPAANGSGTTFQIPDEGASAGHSYKVEVTEHDLFAAPVTAVSRPTSVVMSSADVAALALVFRPALLFDTNETYRPISLDSFFAEGGHQLCLPDPILVDGHCHSITAPDQIVPTANQLALDYQRDAADTFIWIEHGDDGYKSPSAPCGPSGTLLDCDDSPAIYYDYAQSVSGYRFLDYWFWYRNNPVTGDNHAGDWEGLTVWLAPPTGTDNAQPEVAGVVFGEHSKKVFRLPLSMQFCAPGAVNGSQCDGGANATHVGDFVASDSHASYESVCTSDDCWNPETYPGTSIHLSDGRHNGEAGWAANDDAICGSTCVLSIPTGDWSTYVGRWGGSTGNVVTGVGRSPDSPGLQGRYLCTQATWTCDGLDVDDGDPAPDPNQLSVASRTRPSPNAFSQCDRWWDGGLAAFACSPSLWKKTVAKGETMKPGRFRLVIAGRHTGTAPGLVQVVGGPLTHPTTVGLAGHLERDEVVAINYMINGRLWVVRLTQLRPAHGPTVHIGGATRPIVELRKLRAKVKVARAGT